VTPRRALALPKRGRGSRSLPPTNLPDHGEDRNRISPRSRIRAGPYTWRFYNGRADCENRIKELKLDFAADGFCLRSFQGTEAVLQLNCLLFNLLTAFKDEVLADPSPTLGTMRSSLFVLGALLRASARRSRLFLGLIKQKTRDRFAKLLARLQTITPTVAQLALDPPPPWRKYPSGPADFLRYCPLVPT